MVAPLVTGLTLLAGCGAIEPTPQLAPLAMTVTVTPAVFLPLTVNASPRPPDTPPRTAMPTTTPTWSPTQPLSILPSNTPSRPATRTPTHTETATPVPTATPTLTHTGTATPVPTATPTPPQSSLRAGTVSLLAYPYEPFLRPGHNAAQNYPFQRLAWPAYEAVSRSPISRSLPALVLENQWLELTFLPDLGGRLYRAVYKPTGRDLFYRNPVLKPTHWGPPDQGWWLAVGGMEWALPVDEHGYAWLEAWAYTTATGPAGVSLTLRDSDATDRLRARVTVTLPHDRAAFSIRAWLENPTNQTRQGQFWINAMLAPAGDNRIGPETRILWDPPQVMVHSAGDASLRPRQMMPWPGGGGRDWSRYGNWTTYLGAFAPPGAAPAIIALFDMTTQTGVARQWDEGHRGGVKIFGLGDLDPGLWTDDHSSYFEIWTGLPYTFFPEDNVTLAPGASLEWQETWFPLVGAGDLQRWRGP